MSLGWGRGLQVDVVVRVVGGGGQGGCGGGGTSLRGGVCDTGGAGGSAGLGVAGLEGRRWMHDLGV